MQIATETVIIYKSSLDFKTSKNFCLDYMVCCPNDCTISFFFFTVFSVGLSFPCLILRERLC
jgi:hypothetical protein